MSNEELLAKSTALNALCVMLDYVDDNDTEELLLAVTKLTKEITKEVNGLTL